MDQRMRFSAILSIISVVMLSFHPCIASAKGGDVLASGTSVPFQIDRIDEDGTVTAHVIQEIRTNKGTLVIRNGAPLVISADIQEGKAPCKAGSLKITRATVKTTNGKQILLTGRGSAKAEENVGLCIGLTVGLFFVIFLFSLFMLAIPGEDVGDGMVIHGFATSQSVSLK